MSGSNVLLCVDVVAIIASFLGKDSLGVSRGIRAAIMERQCVICRKMGVFSQYDGLKCARCGHIRQSDEVKARKRKFVSMAATSEQHQRWCTRRHISLIHRKKTI